MRQNCLLFFQNFFSFGRGTFFLSRARVYFFCALEAIGCFRKKKKSRILPLFLPDFTISIMVKTGLFLNAFTSFAFALKKRYFTTIFL